MTPREKMSRLDEYRSDSAARVKLTALFDEGSFVEVDALLDDSVVTGYGAVDGSPAYAFAQNATVLTASAAARIVRLYALAVKNGAPVIAVYDSPGAKLTEGVDLLASYGALLRAANNLSGVVPQIAVVTGACLGASALMAAAADFLILTKDAQFYLSDKSDAETAAREGVCHVLAEDADAALNTARRLAAMLPSNNLAVAPLFECADTAALDALCDSEPDAKSALKAVADEGSLILLGEMHADAVTVGLGNLGGIPTAFAAASGVLCPCACKKLARFVQFADAFSLPLVTFVDVEGFKADHIKGIREFAKLANVYAEATCVKAAVVVGRGYGPAFVALAGKSANADMVYAWPNAVISPLKPETAVSILYNDKIDAQHTREQLVAEYEDGEASAFAAAMQGGVDDVIDPSQTRSLLISALDLMAGKRENKLPKKHTTL